MEEGRTMGDCMARDVKLKFEKGDVIFWARAGSMKGEPMVEGATMNQEGNVLHIGPELRHIVVEDDDTHMTWLNERGIFTVGKLATGAGQVYWACGNLIEPARLSDLPPRRRRWTQKAR